MSGEHLLGEATITLHSGQQKVISEIPEGVEYTVTEVDTSYVT